MKKAGKARLTILKHANILQVAQSLGFESLKETSEGHIGICPKHTDSKSKSNFEIYTATQSWCCRHSGKGGSVLEMVQYIKDMEWYEAAQFVCDLIGIDNPYHDMTTEEKEEYKLARIDREYLDTMLTKWVEYCHKLLMEDRYKTHLDFLIDKVGFGIDLIKRRKLGICPANNDRDDGFKTFPDYIFDSVFAQCNDQSLAGIEVDRLMKTGIFNMQIMRGQTIPTVSGDYFAGRLIYPYWVNGKVKYICGRAVADYTEPYMIDYEEQPVQKYLKIRRYDPEHSKKKFISRHLENEVFMGEDTIRGKDEVIITEGAPDCLSADELGYGVLSPVTIRFRNKDIEKVYELCKDKKKIYLVNDNEENKAGEAGARKTCEYLCKRGMNVYFVTLPRDEEIQNKVDLNSYVADLKSTGHTVEQIREKFDELIESSVHYLEMVIDESIYVGKIEETAARVDENVIPLLRGYSDLQRDGFIDLIFKKTGIKAATIRRVLKQKDSDDRDEQEVTNDTIIDENMKPYQERFFVSTLGKEGGSTLVFEPLFHEVGRTMNLQYQKKHDFIDKHQTDKFELWISGSKQELDTSKYWFEKYKERRTFSKVVFDPTNKIEAGDFNMWGGFYYEHQKPDEGKIIEIVGSKFERFNDHIFENICVGNQDYYDYLIQWMAHGIQYPGIKPGVAVVMRGAEGTGKGTLANHYGHLFGSSFLTITNSKQVAGNHNEHLMNCVFLFCDEAFYGGKREYEGILKAMITEEETLYNPKGISAFAGKSYLKIMLASNQDWPVPAGPDARRFFVLDLSDQQKAKSSYFGPLISDLENGGYHELFWYLKNKDLSNFDIFKFPVTEGLRELKEMGLDPFLEFIRGKLDSQILDPETGNWDSVLRNSLRSEYLEEIRTSGKGTGWRLNNRKFTKGLKSIFGSHPDWMTDRATTPRFDSRGNSAGRDEDLLINLPDITICRRLFEKATNNIYEWSEVREQLKVVDMNEETQKKSQVFNFDKGGL